MYAIYRKQQSRREDDFEFWEPASLFGCKKGYIPWLLQRQIPRNQNEPYAWHIDVQDALNHTEDYQGGTLLIDLKPKQKDSNLSLYELLDVWGYSSYSWTPILLHLSGLFVDADPKGIDRNQFAVKHSQRDDPIYEFLYLDGSVSSGGLTGRWCPPPMSATNGALLWPNVLKYFFECINERTPAVLSWDPELAQR